MERTKQLFDTSTSKHLIWEPPSNAHSTRSPLDVQLLDGKRANHMLGIHDHFKRNLTWGGSVTRLKCIVRNKLSIHCFSWNVSPTSLIEKLFFATRVPRNFYKLPNHNTLIWKTTWLLLVWQEIYRTLTSEWTCQNTPRVKNIWLLLMWL